MEIQSRGEVQECTKPQTEYTQRCIAKARPYKITHPATLLIYVTALISPRNAIHHLISFQINKDA
jgi:hypothetical protein